MELFKNAKKRSYYMAVLNCNFTDFTTELISIDFRSKEIQHLILARALMFCCAFLHRDLCGHQS